MKIDRLCMPLVALAVVAGVILAFVNPGPRAARVPAAAVAGAPSPR